MQRQILVLLDRVVLLGGPTHKVAALHLCQRLDYLLRAEQVGEGMQALQTPLEVLAGHILSLRAVYLLKTPEGMLGHPQGPPEVTALTVFNL
jgi:hypothetical protein